VPVDGSIERRLDLCWNMCRKAPGNRVVACRTMKRFLITGDAAGARAFAGPRAER
jgi:hypothetical protein